jgi:hypothetical protein
MGTREGNFISLRDHCQFKYLFDIEGVGYSARLKVLLFSGRPVFVQARPWQEYFFRDMKPFVHYIPVARDLGDLREQLDWAEENKEKCAEIAENARSFAKAYLTRSAAISYLGTTLIRFSESRDVQ